MLPPGAAGDAYDAAPGMHVPVGRAKAGEGGHQVDTAVVRHLLGVVFGVTALAEQPQLVPQPLNDRAAHEHRAFQRILHLAAQPHRNGGDKAVAALARGIAGVHQQKAAGAVGVFGFARVKAGLAEQRGLLVACHAGDGHLYALNLGIAVNFAGRTHLRQHGAGDVQGL